MLDDRQRSKERLEDLKIRLEVIEDMDDQGLNYCQDKIKEKIEKRIKE
jgi:hypothetical protein